MRNRIRKKMRLTDKHIDDRTKRKERGGGRNKGRLKSKRKQKMN